MTAEEIQNVIVSLNNSIEQFTARLEAVVLGIPKNKDANAPTSSIINIGGQTESMQSANERNGDIGPSDIKYIDELYKKFKPLFDDLKPKSSVGLDKEQSDLADVLKGDEAEKITKVSIVNISDDALESLRDALKGGDASAKGGGFLSSILGLLGGAGATVAGGGLVAILTALPNALPGIAVALGTVVAGAAAFAAAAAIIVKTISYLKEDIVKIFPIIKDFAKLFTEVAIEVIPVVGKALGAFVTTVLPVLLSSLKEFASVIIPIVIKAVGDLMDSPGFKFLTGAFLQIISKTFETISTVITTALNTAKSIITDVKDALVSLFVNLKEMVVPIIDDIKNIFTSTFDSLKQGFVSLFENIKETLVPISNDVKQTLTTIGDQVKTTVLGALDKIDSVFTKVPAIIGSILNKIKDFASGITTGKIGAVANEVRSLAIALGAMTASSLLNNIGEFFTKSPFDKIIDFQNKIDEKKLGILSTLAPNLKELVNVNADQLNGLSSVIDELINKSIQVSATVEKIFSGESGWFKKSGGILEIVDKLESAKQGAENTVTSAIVKTSDAQRKISELQLNETKMTNKILGEIFKKMNAMSINATSNAPASTSKEKTIDARLPLQFTSVNTRQQMVQSGAVI